MPMHHIGLSRAWDRVAPCGGEAVWIRRFGRSRRLDPSERVNLVIEGVSVTLTIRLNDGEEQKVKAGTARWTRDLTGRLEERNTLVVTFAATTPLDPMSRRSPFPEDIARMWLEIGSSR